MSLGYSVDGLKNKICGQYLLAVLTLYNVNPYHSEIMLSRFFAESKVNLNLERQFAPMLKIGSIKGSDAPLS